MIQTDTEGFTQLALGSPSASANNGVIVQFHWAPEKNDERSTAEGRPIFEDKEYIRIFTVGDKDNIVDRPVWPVDRQRFAKEYAEWKAKGSQTRSGTPLSALTILTQAEIKELEYFHVHTVEDLANLSDTNAQKFMGVQGRRQKARDYLAAAKDASHLTQMRSEMEKKDREIDSLMKALKEQADRLERLEKAQRKV